MQAHGSVLIIVDQPNTISTLPIAVARDCGCTVGYLPALAIHKTADPYPSRAAIDRRDAFIIADTARTKDCLRNRVKKDPAATPVDAIFAALTVHTITVPGIAAAGLVISQLAANIKALQHQRDTLVREVEEMLESFPLAKVLIPDVGIKTASTILMSIGD